MLHTNDYTCFNIKNKKDLFAMQKELNHSNSISTEKKYIALELAENMIEAHEEGEIKINGIEIVNIINDTKCKSELEEFIERVKSMYQKGETGSVKKDGRKNGGRGLLSILYAGWNLKLIQEEKEKLALVVFKRAS